MTPTRIKLISVLILVGAFPLSGGIIFHSSWMTWAGLAIVGVAVLCFVVEGVRGVWWYLHLPNCRVAKTESKAVADEYLRLGWVLKHEFRGSGDGESSVYLLEWLRDGDPVHVNLSKFVEKEADANDHGDPAHRCPAVE